MEAYISETIVVLKTKNITVVKNFDARVHTAQYKYETNMLKNSTVLSAESKINSQIKKCVHKKVNEVNIKLQLHTGSDISLINNEVWKKIGKSVLRNQAKTTCDE